MKLGLRERAMSEVTQMLKALEAGRTQATEELLPPVYDELRRLAHHNSSLPLRSPLPSKLFTSARTAKAGGESYETQTVQHKVAFKPIKAGRNMTAHSTWKEQGKRVLGLVAGVVLITCAGCQTHTYTHSKFRERSAHLTTVAFLPPQIKTGMASNLCVIQLGAPLPEETKIRAELPCLIAAEFRKRGFAVKESTSESMLPDSTNQVWNAHMQGILNAAYGTVRLKAVRPEAKVLADRVRTDGLVFLNVFAYKSTEGRKVAAGILNMLSILAAAGGGPAQWTPYSQAMVQIALVDGETGDVLWRTVHDFTDFERTDPNKVVAELMKTYPQR